MKNFIRDYFTFNKREQNGIIILGSIILVLIFAINITPYFLKDEATDFSLFQKELAEYYATRPLEKDTFPEDKLKFKAEETSPEFAPKKFRFDPNLANEKMLADLGLSKGAVKHIRNYKKAGGRFFYKEDLKKIHSISPEQLSRLEEFIDLPSKAEMLAEKEKKKTKVFEAFILELNSADSASLLKLKGIGPSFAKRIIAYRNRLGGFITKNQLFEIYGLDSNKFSLLRDQVVIDSLQVKKIQINKAVFEDLRKHPYIGYNLAGALMNFRQKHGPFTKPADLRKVDLVNDELYRKIAPYISFP